MGVVYYANYYVWMEIGRVELVRSLGIDYHTMEQTDGLLLSVVESHCRYIAPARYDQEIAICTEITSSNSRLVEFQYEIRNAESRHQLASGATKHMWLNREFRPTKLPGHYLKVMEQAMSKEVQTPEAVPPRE
jgi:acyl-CoA thioester hydrolase